MNQGTLGGKKIARPALGRGLSALVSAAVIPTPIKDQTQTSSPALASNFDRPNTPPMDEQANRTPAALVASQSNQSFLSSNATPSSAPQLNEQPEKGPAFLSISQLRANPEQPRQDFADIEIAELAESIKALGVIQPILVRPNNTAYQIVAGERRFRAAIRAGLSQVPVVIKELTDKETLEIALVENIQRQGLNPIEEALGYQRLMDEFSLTAAEVAERVGKDRATVSNISRLLKLPNAIQEMLRDGRISVGHAKAILTVKEPVAQIGLANKILAENLSVRAIESIVARNVVLESPKKGSNSELTSELNTIRSNSASPHPELEDKLRNILGTKVTIQKKRRGGSIELHFFSDDELDRLVQILSSTRE